MRRDEIDLHAVRHEHIEIHQRLENWSRWQYSGHWTSAVLPMFRYYRPDNWGREVRDIIPVDERDAVRVQVVFARLPEKHRHAAGWAYVKPWIPFHRVCRLLGVSRRTLAELIHDSRSMMKNRLR